MASYPTVSGDSSKSATQGVSIAMYPSGTYTESWTYGTSVPTSTTVVKGSEDTKSTWKIPATDESSFRAIKSSGSIKMSDYSVGERSETYHVISLPRKAECFVKKGAYTLKNGQFYQRASTLFDLTSSYTLNGDYTRLCAMFPDAGYHAVDDLSDDLAVKINTVMGQVVSDLSSSYDLLTEVAELKQSLELVNTLLRSAITPVRSIRKLIKGGKIRAIGDWWLQYRYGIMPIVYSIQDIAKTLNERNAIYRTVRASESLSANIGPPEDTGTCFYETLEYEGTVRAVGKERITGADLTRLHHRVSTNPFNTAWELVPFSFVVDWFANVSDWITAQSSILSNIGTDRHYCYSVKVSKVKRVYFRDSHDDRRTLTSGPWVVSYGTVFPQSSRQGGIDARADYEVITRSESSYQRLVFQPTQVVLSLDPFVNWKRWADSIALSSSRTRDLLRRR